MVSNMAKIVQIVQAPAPAVGNANIPAPTHTPAIIEAPPNREGCLLIMNPFELMKSNCSILP